MEGAEITKPCARPASITQMVVFFQTHFEGVGGTKAPHGLVGTCDYQKEVRQQEKQNHFSPVGTSKAREVSLALGPAASILLKLLPLSPSKLPEVISRDLVA